MTLTHLIPLSQFVDKIDEIVPSEGNVFWQQNQLSTIKCYTAFLLKPLDISMFVPVSDSGEPLKEPKPEDYFPIDKPMNEFTEEDGKGLSRYYSPMMAYEEAKEKCLFEGFELINNKFFLNEKLIWFAELKGKIEDLDHLNLPLTAKAIKQILG